MGLELFKPEDFKFGSLKQSHIGWVSGKANKILNEYLETLPVVYGKNNRPHYQWDSFDNEEHKHKAKLICIEEIKPAKCEHEPRGYSINTGDYFRDKYYRCEKCGKKLKPNWTEVG